MPFDTLSYLLGKNSGSGGGGGNPNSVQVIHGTAEYPFGDEITGQEFVTAIINGNASATIVYDGTAIGITGLADYICPVTSLMSSYIVSMYVLPGDNAISVGAFSAISEDGDTHKWHAQSLYMYNNGEQIDMTNYRSLITTTTTVYWHPMPSTT